MALECDRLKNISKNGILRNMVPFSHILRLVAEMQQYCALMYQYMQLILLYIDLAQCIDILVS